MSSREHYDYVVVGGGSAGCTVAARLSENPDCSVLLLEAGSRDWNPYIHLPVCYYKTTKGSLTWDFALAPQANQDGIEPVYTQARVLGGGSSINAQVYIRGIAADYDNWEASGCPGWSYRDVLPYFKKAESNERFSGDYHGTEGPLAVSDQRFSHPLSKAFVKACQEFGMPFNADFNGEDQKGAGLYQVTNRNGRRCSAAVAYLRAARKRKNLTVRTGALAHRILIENGRAVGIEGTAGGTRFSVRADRETILTAGAIGTPKLLMLSGIGPSAELAAHGIRTVADVPGVGKNFHDHLDIFMMYNVKGIESYDAYKRFHRQLGAGVQYALFRNGPVSATVVEGGAFWPAVENDPETDVQFHFLAGTGIEAITGNQSTGNGCTLNAYLVRPRSRGSIGLRSADPTAAPVIDPNFLAERFDLDHTVDSVKMGQEIMSRPSMAKYMQNEFMPGSDVRTRADYEAYVRRESRSGYHPAGTCRMGQDELCVVDPELRVRGVDALRIADASVMPRLVSGNTNAPTIMIAEKASDLLRGNHKPFLANPDVAA